MNKRLKEDNDNVEIHYKAFLRVAIILPNMLLRAAEKQNARNGRTKTFMGVEK